VQARRKERLFSEFHAAHAALTDAERTKEAAESTVWDSTQCDGLE
jgi:hypothetical protein